MTSLARSAYELFESVRRSLQDLYSTIHTYLFRHGDVGPSTESRGKTQSRPKVAKDFANACPRSVRDGVLKKLMGRRLIIDSNILMHWKGQLVAKAIAKSCATTMDKIFVPPSQWRELIKGSQSKDQAKSRLFRDALLLLAKFERNGVVVRDSSVQVNPYYGYADDEIVAHIAGWTNQGVPCALITCDIELGDRIRALASRCAKGMVLLINQTVIGSMVGQHRSSAEFFSTRPATAAI